MNYERLMKFDKKALIGLIIDKDERLIILNKKYITMEKLGRLFIDDKYYWIWREKIIIWKELLNEI